MFAAVQRLADRRWLPAIALLIIAAAVLLPGQASMPVTDRDEGRYIIASRQMMETSEYIDIRNQDDPRWKKPVGIYWLQVAAARMSGQGANAPIRAYRAPSALAAAAAGLLAFWAFAPVAGRRAAFVAGVALVTSLLVIVEGHIAKTDAALLATIMAAQGALLRIALDRERRFDWLRLLFWAALALGTLIKGPIAPLAVGFACIWLTVSGRDWTLPARLAPLRGLALYALLTLPWFIAIGLRTDGAFYAESIARDLLGKVGTGQENHGAPPGYYIATIWVTFWPWAPFALLGLPAAWASRHDLAMRFAAGAILPLWLGHAIAATKLVHYMLPAFPALALIAALGLTASTPVVRPWLMRIAAVLLLVPGLLLAALLVGPPLFFESAAPIAAVLFAVLSGFLTVVASRALWRAAPCEAFGPALLAAIVTAPAILALSAPATPTLFPSTPMANMHARFDACAERPLVSVGYHEPSLVVAAGTQTRLIERDAAVGLLAESDGWRVFLDTGRGIDAETLAADADVELQVLGRIEALNYNGGGETVVELVARADDPLLAGCLSSDAN